MKFCIKSISKLFLMCTVVTFAVSGTFAADNTECLYGGVYEYCGWGSKCKACPANCYCPKVKSREVKCTGWTGIWCDATNRAVKSNTNADVGDGAFGIHLCPAGYNYSDPGATSAENCYAKCGNGQTLYYEQKSCKSGEFRPQKSNDCKPCPDDGKSYCTGTSDFYPTCDGASSDDGLKTCDTNKGKVPNSTRTACVDKQCGAGEELKDGKCVSTKIHCIAGEYLPANSESCAACPSGKVCLGGDFDKRSIDQGDDGTCDGNNIINSKGSGCTPCPAGTAPNENHTVCTEAAIPVEPGYYLPANKITPTKCSGARKYCPGGNYKKGITDVGIFECPFSGRANADGTACNVTITEEQMQYGPAGKNAPLESQCWLRTDPDDYRTCIFGTRFDVSNDK